VKLKVILPAGLNIRDTYEASPSRTPISNLKILQRDHTHYFILTILQFKSHYTKYCKTQCDPILFRNTLLHVAHFNSYGPDDG